MITGTTKIDSIEPPGSELSPSVPPDRTQLERLIPHAGSMCLIDRVIAWDAESIQCESASHRDSDNPLRLAATLPALALVEYGAQAMAIHGGLLALKESRAPALPGYLAALHGAKFHVDRLDDLEGNLEIEARTEIRLDRGVVYTFTVGCGTKGILMEARATVINLELESFNEDSSRNRRQR